MDMAVDQAGDHIAPGQIDLPRAGDIGGGQAAMRRQRDDPVAAHQHVLIAARRRAGAVDDGRATIEYRLLGRLGRLGKGGEGQGAGDQGGEAGGVHHLSLFAGPIGAHGMGLYVFGVEIDRA